MRHIILILAAIRIIYPCAHDMPYTSAIFLAGLPTMSDLRDQLARNGRKLFKSTIQPTSSLHNLPLLRNSHLSLDYKSPQNFLASPPEPKNTNHSSHMLSPTIKLHNNCVFSPLYIAYCFFVFVLVFPPYCFFVFVSVFALIVQPLAITFQ